MFPSTSKYITSRRIAVKFRVDIRPYAKASVINILRVSGSAALDAGLRSGTAQSNSSRSVFYQGANFTQQGVGYVTSMLWQG